MTRILPAIHAPDQGGTGDYLKPSFFDLLYPVSGSTFSAVRIPVFVILLLPSLSLFPLGADPMTDVRHGIPLSGFSAWLIQNPQPVIAASFAEDPSGDQGFWGWIDFHALYPVESKYFARSISDVPALPRFVPHVSESTLLSIENSDPVHIRVMSRLVFDYFIFKTSYSYISEEHMGKIADGDAVYLDFRLESRLEGGLTYVSGSWYLEPVVLDGKEYTYARYYCASCVQDLPGIVKLAIRTFPGAEVPSYMNAFFENAKILRDADAGGR
jgi:hypothetical protein